MKKICLFSSNARSLYKRDVFRVMALPSGYTIHFRYLAKYVGLDLMKLDSYKEKSCAIFFTWGNELVNQQTLVNYSLREAIIEDIRKNDDTGLVHFYLKLKDFKEFEIQANQESIAPPTKYVSELDVEEKEVKPWHEIVSNIKSSFKDQLMYKFNLTNDSNTEIEPKFDKAKCESYYLLEDESSYSLNIAFYDTSEPRENKYQSIKFEQSGELLKINAPSIIEIGALRDNKSFNVFTNSLNSANSFTYLNFISEVKNSEESVEENYNVEIQVQVEKNQNRAIKFATYSILALTCAGFGKILSDYVDINGNFSLRLALFIAITLIFGALSAYKLYTLFNKK